MTEEVALNVKFTGDSSGVVTESRRAADSVDQYGNKIQRNTETTHQFSKAGKDAQKSIKAMGSEMLSLARSAGIAAAAVGAAAATALVKITKDGLEAADAVAKTSDKLGIATEKIAAYSLAAKDTGVSQDRVFAAIQKTSRVLVDAASGSDSATRALAALNLEAGALLKLSPDQAFERIMDSVAAIEDPMLKAALAAKVFGRGGAELVNFLNLGSDGLEEFARKSEIAGTALSREMVAKVEMANDAVELLGVAMDGFGQQLAVKVAPILLELADRTFDFAEQMGGMGEVADKTVEGLVTGAGKIVTAWEFVATGFHAIESVMRTVNAVAATTIEFMLKGAAVAAGPFSQAGQEMLKLAQSFHKESIDEAIKAEAAWAATAASVENYGKAEERLKDTFEEVTESANKRAAALAGMRDRTKDSSEETGKAADKTAALVGSLSALSGEQQKATEALEKAAIAFNHANDPAAKFAFEIAEIKKLQASGKVTQDAINGAILKAALAYETATGASKEFAEAEEARKRLAEEGVRLTESLRTPTEAYADEIERLNELKESGAITDEVYARGAVAAAEKIADANVSAAETSTTAWQDFGQSVSEAFRDTFIQADGNLNDFLKRAEEALKEAARRWLFDSTIGRLFGGVGGVGVAGGATASTGAVGGSSSGGITSLLGGNYGSMLSNAGGALLTGANYGISQGTTYLLNGLNAAGYTGAATGVSNLYAGLTTSGNSLGNIVGVQGGGAALGSLATAGAGLAGSYVGNILGESIFNKEAESNIGSTIGATGGAYLGAQYGSTLGPYGTVIGAAVGAIVGALADVALGGDGKKRSNTGAIVGPTAVGGTVAASGLRIAPYDRRGDNAGTAALTSALVQIDEVLTGVARSAGVSVDFSNTALRGRNPDAGHDGPGIFFGGKGFNGGSEGFTEAPKEFIRAWIEQINDQLPLRVREIMQGVDGAADALVSGFAAAVEIDNLLDLDVVKDTKRAVEELLTPQKSLLELYDVTTERVMALASGIDGNAESLVKLSEALREQKTTALELALAYQGVQLETASLFGGAIDDIRHALMSEEELYNERRAQIADLTDQLRTSISPDEISRLNSQIVGLSSDAFRSLDGSQQQTLGQEFLGFLAEAQRISEEQLAAGLASLASREEGIERTIELELSIAQQQQQAANTFETATDRFAGWVERLTSGETEIVINIPGYGSYNVPLNLSTEITL